MQISLLLGVWTANMGAFTNLRRLVVVYGFARTDFDVFFFVLPLCSIIFLSKLFDYLGLGIKI